MKSPQGNGAPTRMGIDESASTVRFGWSDEGVTTSTSRVAGRNTLLQWFESIYQSPAVLVFRYEKPLAKCGAVH